MNRRDFIKQMGNIAITATTATLVVEGMLLKRAGASSVSLDGLRQAIGSQDGTVLAKTDSGFNSHRPGFNLRFDTVPQVIVLCKTPKAVVAALNWARTNGVPLRPRSGGHSYEGLSLSDGIVIDVSPMNSVAVDTAHRTATIGAGAKLGNVYQSVAAHGLAMVAGSCATVGVSGLTLGGGHGLLSRKYGTTCDNLISLKIVSAAGEILQASETENADLFWACRGGGGGNFGIAIEFTFKVHPVTKVVVFGLRWPASQAKIVMQAWQKIAPNLPDEVTCLMNVTGTAQGGLQDIKVSGQFCPRDENHAASESELAQILKPLTSIGNPSLIKITSKTFPEAVTYWAGGEDPPVYFKSKSDYARDPLSPSGIDELLHQLSHLKTGAIAALFDSYGGAINRVPTSATAFPHREGTLYCVQYFSQWSNSSKTQASLDQSRAVYAAMRPYFSGQAYINYIDLDVQNWQTAYYGDNFTRLTQVKQAYDPENLFKGVRNIPLPG